VISQDPTIPGNPVKVVDLNTAIPGGTSTFTAIPVDPIISGDNVAFLGNGSGGSRPVSRGYDRPAAQARRSEHLYPRRQRNFTSFIPTEPIAPAIDGTSVAFFAAGSGGQQGIYVSNPTDPTIPGNPVRIADTATAIPGGTGNFTGFRDVTISATDVAFLGLGANGQQGIYDMTGGSLLKVVDLTDLVDGRAITGLNLSRSALVGDPLAFQLTFADGSQALYTWSAAGHSPATSTRTAALMPLTTSSGARVLEPFTRKMISTRGAPTSACRAAAHVSLRMPRCPNRPGLVPILFAMTAWCLRRRAAA